MMDEKQDEELEERPEERPPVIRTFLIVLAVVLVGLSVLYFAFLKKPKSEPVESAAKTIAETVPEGRVETDKPVPEVPPVELGKSDDLVRQMAKEVSSHPRLATWLQSQNIIRKFTAAVDNIANGQSPRKQVDFFNPSGVYKVTKKGTIYVTDPSSYARYNQPVDVFISLDPGAFAGLFRAFKPLFQEAYKDLGYPDADFEDTLVRAIVELLKTPIVEREIPMEKSVVTYRMLDSRLESLSEAQKHLLRMGPENVGSVQLKLREIARALDVPDYRIPKPLYLIPEMGK